MFLTWKVYGNFKDLTRRTASDKILHDKAFNIAKNSKYNEYQRILALMFHKYFDKKASAGSTKLENKSLDLKQEYFKQRIS